MPGFDGTGPRGQGPMTGRGMGRCGTGRGNFGNGFGMGRGRGFGRGFGFAAPERYTVTKEQEIADLKAQRDIIKKELEALEQRLNELEKE